MKQQSALEKQIRQLAAAGGIELQRKEGSHIKYQLRNPETGASRLMVIPSTVGQGRAYKNNISLARRLIREVS